MGSVKRQVCWPLIAGAVWVASLAGCQIAGRDEFAQDESDSLPVRPVWNDARTRGVDFRALGQEPGWLLEIDHEGELLLVGNYGEFRLTLPTPAPEMDEEGGAIYESITEEHALKVMVWKVPCSDVMSGEAYDYTVVVIIDGGEYRGCGRYL